MSQSHTLSRDLLTLAVIAAARRVAEGEALLGK
jgi:hypothetical protein